MGLSRGAEGRERGAERPSGPRRTAAAVAGRSLRCVPRAVHPGSGAETAQAATGPPGRTGTRSADLGPPASASSSGSGTTFSPGRHVHS